MKCFKNILLLFLILGLKGFGKECKVANVTEFDNAVKHLMPGDNLILQNGTWNNANLTFKGFGTKDQPIVLSAEANGKVILSGNSSLKLAGKHLIVDGLWFKDGYTTEKAVISFRVNSKEIASYSKVTNSAITNYNPTNNLQQYFYMELWGKENVVDYNHMEGKTNDGPTLVVWLSSDDDRENNHLIRNNYFGKRPPLGRNGGETIRIGTSHNSMFSSRTVVENNVFYQCDGEGEIISNKSNDNVFRNNLFLESQGSLTLRHGNRAIVEKNVFNGNGKENTGGVRIINEDHIVRNNLFMGLRGSGFKSSLVIMNGIPNSPLNRYHQVKNSKVINNTFIDSSPIQFGAGKDKERTLPPIESSFTNNLILNPWKNSTENIHDDISGISFKNNLIISNKKVESQIFPIKDMELKLCNEILFPESADLNKLELDKNISFPENDITDKERNQLGIGAFISGNYNLPKAMELVVGPAWKQQKEI